MREVRLHPGQQLQGGDQPQGEQDIQQNRQHLGGSRVGHRLDERPQGVRPWPEDPRHYQALQPPGNLQQAVLSQTLLYPACPDQMGLRVGGNILKRLGICKAQEVSFQEHPKLVRASGLHRMGRGKWGSEAYKLTKGGVRLGPEEVQLDAKNQLQFHCQLPEQAVVEVLHIECKPVFGNKVQRLQD